MISPKKYDNIHIHITTKNKGTSTNHRKTKTMNENYSQLQETKLKESKNNRFICSICLNCKPNTHKYGNNTEKRSSCPVCESQYNSLQINKLPSTEDVRNIEVDTNNMMPRIKTVTDLNKNNSKIVQTSQTGMDENVDLLNEVLTVFQRKKSDNPKEHRKTIKVKDACVSTEFTEVKFTEVMKDTIKLRSQLGLSKIFQYSVEGDNRLHDDYRFNVLIRCEPQMYKKSCIDLIKHKSDSIPLMKMDELKKSLKEKGKSKDTIEEVNRMFATFKKKECLDDSNRPVVRNGPRVLPVVKNRNIDSKKDSVSDDSKCKHCKYCRTHNYLMSSGDSKKNEGCQITDSKLGYKACDKSVYMMCCHYQKQMQAGLMVCECCKNDNNMYKKHEMRHYGEDSSTSY